jgi:hypothetical protein
MKVLASMGDAIWKGCHDQNRVQVFLLYDFSLRCLHSVTDRFCWWHAKPTIWHADWDGLEQWWFFTSEPLVQKYIGYKMRNNRKEAQFSLLNYRLDTATVPASLAVCPSGSPYCHPHSSIYTLAQYGFVIPLKFAARWANRSRGYYCFEVDPWVINLKPECLIACLSLSSQL